MTDNTPSQTAAEPVHTLDYEELEATVDASRWDRYGGRPELYIASERRARVWTTLVAVTLLVVAAGWGAAGAVLFSPPELVCGGCAPTDLFRWTQLLLAVAGVAATLLAVAYAAYFAISGRTWRNRRQVEWVFGVLLGAWSAVVLINFVLTRS